MRVYSIININPILKMGLCLSPKSLGLNKEEPGISIAQDLDSVNLYGTACMIYDYE